MKVTALYHPASEFARPVEEFARDFEHRNNKKIELVSLETREGAALASLYDIVSYPTLVAVTDDGRVQKIWQGMPLPLMDEVAAYLVA